MREIKFRAYCKEQKVFQEFFIGFKNLLKDKLFIGNLWKSIDKLEINQYTGLKDKNDVEIYEGDICKIEKCFSNGIDKLSDHIGEVKYTYDRFMVIDEYMNSLSPYKYIKTIEIIGNIYEHSYLLDNK